MAHKLNSEMLSNATGDKRSIATLIQSMSSQRQEQKQRFRRVTDFYYGNYAPHYTEIFEAVIKDFDNTVGEAKPRKDRMNFEHSFFTRTVVNQMALIYRDKPKRIFIDGKGEEIIDEKKLAYYEKVYDWLGVQKDQTFNKMVKANGTCLYRVLFRNGKLEGDVYTPDWFDIVQNPEDMTQAMGLIYELASTDSMDITQQNATKFVFWSDKELKIIWVNQQKREGQVTTTYPVNNVEITPFGKNTTTDNPYKIMPFTKVTETTPLADYFDDENANLFDNADSTLTLKKTAKGETYLYQGFDVAILTTSQKNEFDGFILSPADVVVLEKGNPQEVNDTLEYLSSSDQITSLEEVYKEDFTNNAAAFGLEAGSGNVDSNQSGVSIALSKDSQNKIINADRPKYETFEKERWEIIKSINNYHLLDSDELEKIDEDVEIVVEFPPIEVELPTSEQIDLMQFDLDNGLIERADILRERNPDLTDEQIQDKLARIDAERAILIGLNTPLEPLEDLNADS